jgi:hypothetical protein
LAKRGSGFDILFIDHFEIMKPRTQSVEPMSLHNMEATQNAEPFLIEAALNRER